MRSRGLGKLEGTGEGPRRMERERERERESEKEGLINFASLRFTKE
jgi:hypothetical protein